jgi:serine/threonine protein kinase
VDFDLPCLRDYLVNLSVFEAKSIIDQSDRVSNQIHHRVEDDFLVILKSIPLSECIKTSQVEHEIERLINLRHPCITVPIGFVTPIEPGRCQELKILELYSESCSLAEVLFVRPKWWTSTAKAKVIAGIVLGLRFAHSVGLFHGHLTTNNIHFDSDHCIQIADFDPILLKVDESQSEEER